ncbi:MAG TPA: pentapeptide repeat-containing protein, partial [Anseongella sp.]|nr:pentapeptide repeat-containing protein [Anseongella sp.]
MLTPEQFERIGTFAGAFFLNALDDGGRRKEIYLEADTRFPEAELKVYFPPPAWRSECITTEIQTAFYLDAAGTTLYVQDLRQDRWLQEWWAADQHRWTFKADPLALQLNRENHYLLLSYTAGGNTYDAVYTKVNGGSEFFRPRWQQRPHGEARLKLQADGVRNYITPVFPHPPDWFRDKEIPAPEVLRQGARRENLNFYCIYLVNTDLSGSNLPGANFSQVTFQNTKFDGAQLPEAQFQERVFTRDGSSTICSFAGANLNKAQLNGCMADRCNFAGASLQQANLAGANLRGADFSGADLT